MCSTAADHALALIEAGLDALAAAGPESSDQARLEKVRRLVAGSNRITACLAGSGRDAETHQSSEADGLKSMKSGCARTHDSRARRSPAWSGRGVLLRCCPPWRQRSSLVR